MSPVVTLFLFIFNCCVIVGSQYSREKTYKRKTGNGILYIDESLHPGFYNFIDPFYGSDSSNNNSGSNSQQGRITATPFGIPAFVGGRESFGKNFCSNGKCAGHSFSDFQKIFVNLFFKRDAIVELDNLNRLIHLRPNIPVKPGKPTNPDGPDRPGNAGIPGRPGFPSDDDGDQCCPTRLSHISDTHLTNTDGIRREIVHFIGGIPPYQQFIPIGQCVSSGICTDCRIQQRLHFLLIVDPDALQFPPVKFDKFYVNSYCSCKNR